MNDTMPLEPTSQYAIETTPFGDLVGEEIVQFMVSVAPRKVFLSGAFSVSICALGLLSIEFILWTMLFTGTCDRYSLR